MESLMPFCCQLFQSFFDKLLEDGRTCQVFPDIDYEDVWYIKNTDLIYWHNSMGFGNSTLPHWPEEDNKSGKYLEVTREELAVVYSSMFIYMIQD